MYIPNTLIGFYILAIVSAIIFISVMVRTRKILLIHRFYISAVISMVIWMLALIGVRFTDPSNTDILFSLDCITTLCAALIPPCSLLFVICYTKKYDSRLQKRYWLLFVVPAVTFLMVCTNGFHHLYYKVFSLQNTSVQFGPYFYIHSLYTFLCVAVSVFLIVRFAIKTKTRLHIRQAVLFTIGSIAPSITNLLVLSNTIEANVAITPISFVITMFFHGIVIFRLHMFDIRPIAMQQLVNWIGDCYLVTNPSGLIVSFNSQFIELFGENKKIRENFPLQDCVKSEDVENKTAIYNLLTALRFCRESGSRMTYEQAISTRQEGNAVKRFYMAEIIPLIVKSEMCGFLSIFRDITQVKLNMQRLQDNQVKMMEQERLAFLGQMVGGLAHNLKTPIMSISGSASAVENLIQECKTSLGDAEVTEADYREIYGEMDSWLGRMRDACAYMSDIISAVRGQASNMSISNVADFPLEEALKRVSLLMRHELLNQHCTFKINYDFSKNDILIHGDINNMVQVINNLVSNSIDAQLEHGNHDIIVDVEIDEAKQCLQISIKDFGCGIPENVKKKLFQEMVTSKGTLGTGLGVFISNTVIRAKFDGSMWFSDNPEGGTIWGISIPLSNVTTGHRRVVTNEEE